MADAAGLDFLVNKTDWKQHRFEDAPVPELAPGQVLFRVDRFAFTANNITYAAAGDMLDYWGFFPAPDGWGRLPTMGFADVLRSAHPEVPEGDRVFGFFPMSQHLLIQADGVTPASYIDAVPHRSRHAPAYRLYTRASRDSIDSLVNVATNADFGILVLGPDDVIILRGSEEMAPRDNVVFELGLFMGAAGKSRTMIVRPRGIEFHVPSDLLGVTPIEFEGGESDLEARLGPVCSEIRKIVAELGVK